MINFYPYLFLRILLCLIGIIYRNGLSKILVTYKSLILFVYFIMLFFNLYCSLSRSTQFIFMYKSFVFMLMLIIILFITYHFHSFVTFYYLTNCFISYLLMNSVAQVFCAYIIIIIIYMVYYVLLVNHFYIVIVSNLVLLEKHL